MLRIPRTLVGFAVINSCTFALDLAIVTALHGGLGWSFQLAVTIGYAVAFALSFWLNRRLNFASHDPVGPQTVRYLGVVAVNFGVILLGVSTLLDMLGVQYQLARVAAGLCEGAFMYVTMRWFVFTAPRPAKSRDDSAMMAEHAPPPAKTPAGRPAR